MVKIEDVTTQILEGHIANGDKQKKNSRKHHPIERLFPKESWQENKIVRFMRAINTFFCNRNFSDVRGWCSTYINR
jgi:hypothetical protein